MAQRLASLRTRLATSSASPKKEVKSVNVVDNRVLSPKRNPPSSQASESDRIDRLRSRLAASKEVSLTMPSSESTKSPKAQVNDAAAKLRARLEAVKRQKEI